MPLSTTFSRPEAEEVIRRDPVDLGLQIVEGEERYLTWARPPKAEFCLW
jgi:hypothetical protein